MRKILLVPLLIFCLCLPVRAEKYVALTFDDGPSGRFTRKLLDGLQSRDAHATFFLCGYRLEQYPDLAQKILESGHEIGIHGFSHKAMNTMCEKEILSEIEKTGLLLPGCEPVLFRPPGGLTTDAVISAAAQKNLAILSWSVDPKDWALHDACTVISRTVGKVGDGDVILLHDMSDSSVDAALCIVDALTKQGFQFVTVSELAAIRNAELLPGRVYRCFPPEN